MAYKSMFSKEDLAEMRKEFEKFSEENHGKQPDEKLAEKKHGGRAGVAFYNNIAQEVADAYISDSVNNTLFAKHKRYELAINYLYSERELELFKDLYVKRGGNLADLKIGVVNRKDKRNAFLCYEVCQIKEYEKYRGKLYGTYK